MIAGGYVNKVTGQYGTVGGGYANSVSATDATIPGGAYNIASGYASFAAGLHANADESGAFVWSDASSGSATKATAANQFLARAAGAIKFFSNATMTTGVTLAPGGGSWGSVSDRAVKTGVSPIDDAGVLDKVAALPISEWSYISERGVRHVDPMAQDFYAAFGVGEDNRHITSIDDGVALAAIKALNQRLVQKASFLQHQLAHTNARLAQKDAALHALQLQVAGLAEKVSKLH